MPCNLVEKVNQIDFPMDILGHRSKRTDNFSESKLKYVNQTKL